MYMLSSLTINVAIDMKKYSTGKPVRLTADFVFFYWFGLAGAIAYLRRKELDAPSDNETDAEGGWRGKADGRQRLAMGPR